MKRLLLVAISVVALATAGPYETIEADKLEAGKIYRVELDELEIYSRGPFDWNATTVYGSHILKVYERKRERGTGKLWYEILWIKPETFDRSEHIRGVVRASDLAKGEVIVLP